jgi:hypothetical protein
MITIFEKYKVNEAIEMKRGNIFSFTDILALCDNDRKRAIPQFKKLILGRRIGIYRKINLRGTTTNIVIVPLRVIVCPNSNRFKLFVTKNPNDENFTFLFEDDKIEILTGIKQIFDPHLDPYGEESWDIDENIKYPVGDPRGELDPYGEEIWDDKEVERQPGKWDRQIRLHDQQVIKGRELFDRWCANDHKYSKDKFIGKVLGDKHVCSHGEPFEEEYDFPFGIGNPLHDYRNPLNAGILSLGDFYTVNHPPHRDIHEYTCPKCFKTSTVEREHGGGWICRKCGLKSRNWGNELYVWE